jgi:hypothetical protein
VGKSGGISQYIHRYHLRFIPDIPAGQPHHHHQLINVPSAGAQAYLVDYSQGERVIVHHTDPLWIGGLVGEQPHFT